jgi:tRNA A37 methylthiotransferase MiaB
MRVRFTSPHPKDFGCDALAAVAAHANICKLVHMPAQSGSSATLDRMRRGYTRPAYDALLARARSVVPGASFSTDIIVGFCGETEEEHEATLDLLRRERYPLAFLFAYSRRKGTHAARHLADDVPHDVKRRRLAEAMAAYAEGSASRQRELVGTRQLVRAPLRLYNF